MWAFRFLSRWSPRQRHSIQAAASIKSVPSDIPRVAPIWVTRRTKTWLAGSGVSSVRFCSQSLIHSEKAEEKEHFLSPSPQSALAPAVQTAETSYKQSQNWFPSADDLHNCYYPSNVLDLIGQYDGPDLKVSYCLNHMWTTMKKMEMEEVHREMQLMFEHPEFEKLLQKAMKTVGQMDCADLSYSLLAMVRLRVPQHSRVVQTFLRTCQEKLNEFDDKSLRILGLSLEHMDSSTNVGALKEGLRLQAEIRLSGVCDPDAFQTVVRFLGKDVPLHLKRKLERKGFTVMDQLSGTDALNLLSTMAKVGFFSKPLLDACSEKIMESIPGLSLRLLSALQFCRTLEYRNLNLFTAISDYVTSTVDQLSNKQVSLFLSAFEKLFFCPAALMRAFAEKVVASPDTLTLKELYRVLSAYSSLNYDLHDHRHQFLERLSQALESHLPEMSGPELLKAVYCLCLMGHFPAAPLERLLQADTLEQFSSLAESTRLLSFKRMFQTVDLCLRLDRPPLPRQLSVPPLFLEGPVPARSSAKPWLSHSLELVLGDQADKMLQEQAVVENVYLIDAVITKPLPDACSAPESSQRIAVISAAGSAFCHGTSNLRGPKAVMLRHLKILGYRPVLVSQQELKSVSGEKRIDLLRMHIFPEQHEAGPTSQPDEDGLDPSGLESKSKD